MVVSRVRESKERHPLHPLHDYDYLFEMSGILYPEIVDDIYKCLELSVISNKAEKSDLVDWLKISSICFPKLISNGLFDFVKGNPELLVDFFGHSYLDSGRLEVMRKICDLEVIQEHPSLLALLDSGQLYVYKDYYGEMPDGDTLVKNIKENHDLLWKN